MIKKFLSICMILTTLCSVSAAGAAEFETRYVDANELNCRSEPNIDSSIKKVFKKNTELQIIGAEGEWWEVYDGEIQGWCYSAYLKSHSSNSDGYNSGNIDGTYLGDFKITYYTCSPTENGGGNYTAKGQRLSDVVGIAIAADPNVIPYYSKVYIEGVGVRTVLDCGGAIKGNKIDVLVKDNSDIPNCGIHNSKVYLVK